jgi:ectoine hydroxylase-related dioxygenase (phytanoyl-CoA dioxygenase family)
VSASEIAWAVRDVGCAIIERFLPEATDHALSELTPYLDRVPTSRGTFTGMRTRRTMRLVTKSLATHEMILNDTLQRALRELFRGEAYHHQLHFTEAVRIERGETAQALHRDDGTFPFRHPSPPCAINTIWALDDFTAENGATRVIPYSHLWNDERKPSEAEAQPAVMPRGSVLVMDAGLYHGGGANLSSRSRTAVLLGYSLGWLRPLENPQLAVPPHIAKDLQAELQDLLGYKTHGFLGNFEGTQPSASWQTPEGTVFPAEDLYGEALEALQVRRR